MSCRGTDPAAVTEPADPPDLAGLPAWIVTDGKAGDENQCLGIAEALGLDVAVRRIPKRLLHWGAPWGPLDPRDAPGRAGGVLEGLPPRILIASGRRSVPYLRAMRRASRGRTFTAFLKDPRTGPGTADFIWVPEHDRLRGANVVATPTHPHRVSCRRLAAARADPDARLAGLPRPRVAVLVGGDSRHLRWRPGDMRRLVEDLARIGEAGLMLTVSRRTPPPLREALRALCAERSGFFWDGSAPGENPYVAMLALADYVVATADSANMVGEAVATGAPVLLFELPDTYIRHRRFFAGLAASGALAPFTGWLEMRHYAPVDATPEIASALARAYARHQERAGVPSRVDSDVGAPAARSARRAGGETADRLIGTPEGIGTSGHAGGAGAAVPPVREM